MLKELRNKKVIIALIFIIMISVLGVTYAFFEYYGVSADYVVSAGEVTLTFNEGTDTIDLTNIFPETKEEARERDDNVITFTVSGVNTTENKDIYYEIMLNEGDEDPTLTRFLPKELMFDLTEINPDGTETLVVDNMNFSEFDDTRIWVNTILKENETTFTRTYELRMWLSDKVLISDTVENADYTTSEFRQRYASVRVSVFGDFNEKRAPYNYMKCFSGASNEFWPDSIEEQKSNIVEVNFVSLPQSEIDARYDVASIKEDVSDTTKGGSVKAWLEIDATDETKYIMYVASDGITYFPGDSEGMFSSFKNLVTIDFENSDTRFVTKMSNMFSACSSLVNLDVSGFDTSQVTVMGSMFYWCRNLSSLDVSNFDTSKVNWMYAMFCSCSSLVNLDVSNFDTSNVTSMESMFSECSNLINIDVSNFKTGNVRRMLSMFSNCTSLVNLDVSGFDTSQVTNMQRMFGDCKKLTSLDISNFDTSGVTNMSWMFNNCYGLTTLDVSNFYTSSVTNMNYMFSGCSSLTSLDVGNFDTSSVTEMKYMFSYCSSLTSLNISSFGTSKVTNMSSMFYNCGVLTSLDLSSFDTSSVTNMYYMFYNCGVLTSLDLSSFDTSSVTNMSNMFSGCKSLTSLDLSGWNISSVTNTSSMFSSCANLITIYTNIDWNTGTITSSSRMFYDCSKLDGAVPYDKNKTDITMANPTTGYFTVKPAEETPAA